jgi:hypothetical protein
LIEHSEILFHNINDNIEQILTDMNNDLIKNDLDESPNEYLKPLSKAINKCRKNLKINELIPKNFMMYCKKLSLDHYTIDNEEKCKSILSPSILEKNDQEKGKAVGFLDLLEDVDQSVLTSSQEELNFQKFNKSKNLVTQIKKSTFKKPTLKKRVKKQKSPKKKNIILF